MTTTMPIHDTTTTASEAAPDAPGAGSRPRLIPPTGEHLLTGWERDVSDQDSVLRNYVATLVDRLRLLAGNERARTYDLSNAFMVDLDSAYVFDNIVVPYGPMADVELAGVVEEAGAFFPAGRAWTLQALTPAVDLRPLGFELLGHPPLMYRPAGPGGRPRVPGDLEIRKVEDAATLRDFERTLIDAYPLPAGSAVLHPDVLDVGFDGWVGYVDDSPVATAGSHTAHGLTEVEWVSTREGHRGRGIGAALTWEATTASPAHDTVLVATDDGRPVYERLGYVALMRLSMWLRG